MKVLFIGGTGTISTAVSELAVKAGIELYLLNRGNKPAFVPEGAKVITADINDEENVSSLISDMRFDAVADFIAYEPGEVLRDWRFFRDKTDQYIFISSTSAYEKPPSNVVITEDTPLSNPFWQYSRNKIACEEALMEKYHSDGFPVTIVRPSHTYGNWSVPTALHGRHGSFSVIERIRLGKKVIVPGDGTSLWTMTHNTDFAKAFIGLLGNSKAYGEAYHITSDEHLTWNQIYEKIGAALGTKTNIVHIASDLLASLHEPYTGNLLGDKANSVIFDNSKIKVIVPGFCAAVSFDEGLSRTIPYIYGHKECQIEDREFDSWCDELIEAYENCSSKLNSIRKL